MINQQQPQLSTLVATQSQALVQQVLLERNELEFRHLQQLLSQSVAPVGDWADLYLQYSKQESWTIEDGIIRHAGFHSGQGFGLRRVCGGESAFAYADELSVDALQQASNFVKAQFRGHRQGATLALEPCQLRSLPEPMYSATDPLNRWSQQQKIALLKRANQLAYSLDSRVVQVKASLSGDLDLILVLDNEGRLGYDVRPLVHFGVTVWLQEPQGERREAGHAGGGARLDYSFFTETEQTAQTAPVDRIDGYVREAVRVADLNLRAVAAPVGMMPVVLGAGWPGVLVHEAIGHGLEADFNRQGLSVYSDKMGQSIAAPSVTIIDQGNLPQRRGSLTIDDEGTATGQTVLVEKGVLTGYLYDRLNAQLMRTNSTGNGRRESYAAAPIPRMTNTYLAAGADDPQEIIASVAHGVYAVNFLGGQVDITSGDFVFTSSEAYSIEHGRLTAPIKGVTLIGQGSEVLKRISMVGHDLQLDSGVGVCGKAGQSVPVGVGIPTIKIDQLQVGGSALS